jgi:hypothetical protein
MEIKGRECEEVKIGEHTYYFITDYKGGDTLRLEAIIYNQGKKEGGDIKEELRVTEERKEEIFKIFCRKILNKSSEEVEVDIEHLRNLSSKEYTEIDNLLARHIIALSGGEKKTIEK